MPTPHGTPGWRKNYFGRSWRTWASCSLSFTGQSSAAYGGFIERCMPSTRRLFNWWPIACRGPSTAAVKPPPSCTFGSTCRVCCRNVRLLRRRTNTITPAPSRFALGWPKAKSSYLTRLTCGFCTCGSSPSEGCSGSAGPRTIWIIGSSAGGSKSRRARFCGMMRLCCAMPKPGRTIPGCFAGW